MMHRALVYLLLTRLKNTVLGMRRRPGRMVGPLLLLALFVVMLTTRETIGDMDAPARLVVLVGLLALYFLLSIVGGLGEPGPIFPPSDVDFVFPAPFRRAEILVYHLLRQYGRMLFVGLFYAVFLGVAYLPNPALAYLGIVLCLVACVHVQTATMLIASRVGERIFGRMRLVSRLALVGLLVVSVVVLVGALAGEARVTEVLRAALGTKGARVAFYPAAAVGDLALATEWTDAVVPLLGLLGVVGGTFLLVLLFPVNFVETAATRTERKRRAAPRGADVRASRRARLALFGGAGAVAWLNALTLRRRLGMIVGALILLVFVMLFAGVRSRPEGQGMPPVVVLLAFLPLLANLPLGFKGHREHLDLLKTLPVGRTRLALAEVAVPVIAIWALQALVLGAFVVTGRLEPPWLAAALIAYPLLDVGAIAISDLFQMGRDRRQLGLLVVTLQMMAIGATVMPAIVVGLVVQALTASAVAGGAAGALVYLGVDVLLLVLLGRRFAAFEASAEAV